jgi:hypothetical protein
MCCEDKWGLYRVSCCSNDTSHPLGDPSPSPCRKMTAPLYEEAEEEEVKDVVDDGGAVDMALV